MTDSVGRKATRFTALLVVGASLYLLLLVWAWAIR